jgi:hemoglobin-like flavoprotein
MTDEQARLVQESFRDVFPIRDAAAAMLFARLFEIDPELRALFSASDMAQQARMLTTALSLVLHGLDRPKSVLPVACQLARRHVHYGVKAHHYATAGRALIDTLAATLGAAFTPDVRVAWQAAYGLLADAMIEAASEEEALAA